MKRLLELSQSADMDKIKSDYIDVDRVVLPPSPQRVRNILTVEERVLAIHAYDCRPMYTKVAKMFNCSWEQIKNIIANRDCILGFYEATKNAKNEVDPTLEEMRQRKLKFLGECMYEFIQRAQFHAKADVTEELIRMKAFEFRDVIQIENFMPTKTWINRFKATYNISLANRQIVLTRTPPASLDLKDIMTYCSKNNSKNHKTYAKPTVSNLYRASTKIAMMNENIATAEELKERRQRKINFLEKALYEYIQRSQYHHKMPLNVDLLRQVACKLKDMLKIDEFFPNKSWFTHFKNRYEFSFSQGAIVMTRTPPLSLDLRDILSYCSRNENKNQNAVPITLTPKEPQTVVRYSSPIPPQSTVIQPAVEVPRIKVRDLNSSLLDVHKPFQEVKQEVIELEDESEQLDVKPNVSQLVPSVDSGDDCEPPPLKIQKIESINQNVEVAANSPGHWSEYSDKEEEELPKHVQNNADALKLLKPLEEYAMLQENYRAIGLLSQLEEIFKNAPKKRKVDDEEDNDDDKND